jgi:hypothetical protein
MAAAASPAAPVQTGPAPSPTQPRPATSPSPTCERDIPVVSPLLGSVEIRGC